MRSFLSSIVRAHRPTRENLKSIVRTPYVFNEAVLLKPPYTFHVLNPDTSLITTRIMVERGAVICSVPAQICNQQEKWSEFITMLKDYDVRVTNTRTTLFPERYLTSDMSKAYRLFMPTTQLRVRQFNMVAVYNLMRPFKNQEDDKFLGEILLFFDIIATLPSQGASR